MEKKIDETVRRKNLRLRAAEELRKKAQTAIVFPSSDVTELTHELGVHQIELEMQNDELQRAQAEIETSRRKFSDLFDFAPVGYIVLDERGWITGANLAAASLLGEEKPRMIGERFSRFVHPEEQDGYFQFYKKMAGAPGGHDMEIRLMKKDAAPLHALLQGTTVSDPLTGATQLRIALMDVTERKKIEAELHRHKNRLEDLVKEQTARLENKKVRLEEEIGKCRKAEVEVLRNEERLEGLLKISQLQGGMQELFESALDEAITLTGSKIGYFYRYDGKKKEFALITWSKGVMEQCAIVEKQTLYQLEKTGIWGEAVRQGKPILINDFHAPNPLKKGYPEGHSQLHRFLTVPVFDEGRIVGVVGVANKETGYDDADVRQLTLLMDSAWKITGRRLAEIELKKQAEDLKTINSDLTRFNNAMVNREIRMIELKRQVNELCVRAGEPPRYLPGEN